MKSLAVAAALAFLSSGCGGKVLDLGYDPATRYATPETVSAEEDAGGTRPFVIAARQYRAWRLALDDTRVYWTTVGIFGKGPSESEEGTESNVVRSCGKTNCAGTVTTYAVHGGGLIAINDRYVYWLGLNRDCASWCGTQSLYACPLRGCDGEPVVIISGILPTNLAADNTHVYWTSSDATLLRCPADGCAGKPEIMALTNEVVSGVGTLALDDERVFWSVRRDGKTSGAIMTVPKDRSAPARALVENLHMPLSIAVDPMNIYWTEAYSLGAVRACSLTGCSGEPTVIASQQSYPGWLTVRDGAAYWFVAEDQSDNIFQPGSSVPGSLCACPITGCGSTPTVLISRQIDPGALAVDVTHVYWTTFGGEINDSAVKRMRRQ